MLGNKSQNIEVYREHNIRTVCPQCKHIYRFRKDLKQNLYFGEVREINQQHSPSGNNYILK